MKSPLDIFLLSFAVLYVLLLVASLSIDLLMRLKKIPQSRKCLDCVHMMGNDEHGKCAKGAWSRKKFDPVTGRESESLEYPFCSTSRSSGTLGAMFGGMISTGKPFCSRNGFFWKKIVRLND